jgi:hypothetical protein
VTSPTSLKTFDLTQLDTLTGGAFTAPTAGERSARIKEWLAKTPGQEQLTEVFKELSVKDKGAAKLVREKLDEAKRAKGQEFLAAEWATKARALLALHKLNIADALAWQRDAAKAGAPLSKEPLAALKSELAERVRTIEDLQHQVQVQREAAVLLAQRIEVLSTKPWADARGLMEGLQVDVGHWQSQASELVGHSSWASVDVKFPPLLESSRGQLLVVWDAFQAALGMAIAASTDPTSPLPPVPVWADELRAARGLTTELAVKAAKPMVDPQIRANANALVKEALGKLEQEVAQGHGKATSGAAGALRHALKEFGKLVDDKLENQAHSALAAAGELEGWQRWRADQLREELVAKAEGLLAKPQGQAIGGRKMQENLRTLREQWKQTDQGGMPNHALWKRFDEACNEAHKVVEAWLEKAKAEATENKAQRLALIEEVKLWAAENRTARDDDWKGFNRILHQFGDRWRDGGHVGEKVFAELQALWKEAISNAAAPLESLQATSLAQRHAMIEEAKLLGAAEVLRVDAVRSLQHRWQAEAHRVPIERRQEQKLWDAFRKPIDEAFGRKTLEREKAEAALSARDRTVLEAAKALEQANAAADAGQIRAAMSALDAALKGQAQARADVTDAGAQESAAKMASDVALAPATDQITGPSDSNAGPTDDAMQATAASEPPAAVKAAPKPVVAVRGDDRPGMKKESAAGPSARPGKWNDRKDATRPGRDTRGSNMRTEDRARTNPWQDAQPRLGDTAFRAQRDALENAQAALKKLAAQAHGEALGQLMTAWEKRDASLVPSAQELGPRVSPATRTAWQRALSSEATGTNEKAAAEAVLRLEIAAEVATPAEHINARRALQLQLLTRRNDPTPSQTWGQDLARVMEGAPTTDAARRIQNVMKVLLKR